MHDGREPCRDELQRFNIGQIRDIQTPLKNSGNVNESKAAKEKQKALKRRSRKIKQRMSVRGQEWEEAAKNQTVQPSVESANKVKFRRNLKDLEKLCQNHAKNSWSSGSVASLERSLGELTRCFLKTVSFFRNTQIYLFGNQNKAFKYLGIKIRKNLLL